MLKSSLLLCAALVAVAATTVHASEPEKEDGVLIGTDDNLEAILKANEYALLEFYAPWCGHCKSLTPEYAKAAQQLAEMGSNVVLVKIDATEHQKVAEEYDVQGYPTLKWFKKGRSTDYSGGRVAADIVSWVTRKSGPPARVLNTVEEAKEFAKNLEVCLIGVFASADTDEAQAFSRAADMSEFNYGIAISDDIAKEYKLTKPGVVLLKAFDEGVVPYTGAFEAEKIHQFALSHQLPHVVEFTDASAQKIFGGEVKNHLIVFVKKASADFATIHTAMGEVATDFLGQILFVYINVETDEHSRIMDFFGVKELDVPTVRLINLAADMAKYRLAGEITAASLRKFANDFTSGALKPHLMSEATPADWDAKPVKVLTGENFETVVNDATKHVFVEFYAPWCGHCKQLTPIWDSLAEKYAKHPSIVIAKIDSTQNELADIRVQSFPTLKYFSMTDKEPVDYSGHRTLAELSKFLHEKTGLSVALTEEEQSAGAGGEEEEDGYDYAGGDGAGDAHDEL